MEKGPHKGIYGVVGFVKDCVPFNCFGFFLFILSLYFISAANDEKLKRLCFYHDADMLVFYPR